VLVLAVLGRAREDWWGCLRGPALLQLSGMREGMWEQCCKDLGWLSCSRDRLVAVVARQDDLGGGNWWR